MRKPVVIILLLCFLFQTGGLYLLMLSRQMLLKKEMRSSLRTNPGQFDHSVFDFDLVNGKPVASSFEWEGDDEFWYNGYIYDLIEKNVVGDKLHVLAINDRQESILIKKMETLEKNSSGHNKTEPRPMQQLLLTLLFNQHNCGEFHPLFSPLLHVDHYRYFFNAVDIDVITPPPRIAILLHC